MAPLLVNNQYMSAVRSKPACTRPFGRHHNPNRPSRKLTIAFSSESNSSYDTYAADSACRTVYKLLDAVSCRDLNNIVEFMPDSAVHQAYAAKPLGDRESPTFKDVVEAMLLNHPRRQFWDSFALRHLVLSAPASCRALSALLVHERKYIHRCAVTSNTGEECVLTITLEGRIDKFTTSSDPTRMSLPTSPTVVGASESYASMRWQLSSIRGEPLHSVLPDSPSPEFPPESVVAAQLEALKRYDMQRIYRHLSPTAKDQVGGMTGLAGALSRRGGPYSALLGHEVSSCVRRCQSAPDTLLALVLLQGGDAGSGALFCWVVKRQQAPPAESSGGYEGGLHPFHPPAGPAPWHHCWMTEMVFPVKDNRLATLLADKVQYPDLDHLWERGGES